ncbi:delta-like protein B [Ruditapes philippinarum]|uniref:delta-like protein B n=1 Tax=Ruditapes philippinarum TaxID=129788 RepID=UPI00295B779A|nr:delta-like protein B [Ruditapes philippinarum]
MQKITGYIVVIILVALCHTVFSSPPKSSKAKANVGSINCDSNDDCPEKYACLSKSAGKGKGKGRMKCYQCECALPSQCYFNGSRETSCNCTDSGFEGEFCNISIVCTENTCQNGGTCTVTGPTTYDCECVPPFSGTNCEIVIGPNPCLPNPCENGGTCSSTSGQFTCGCPPGYTGNRCQTQI